MGKNDKPDDQKAGGPKSGGPMKLSDLPKLEMPPSLGGDATRAAGAPPPLPPAANPPTPPLPPKGAAGQPTPTSASTQKAATEIKIPPPPPGSPGHASEKAGDKPGTTRPAGATATPPKPSPTPTSAPADEASSAAAKPGPKPPAPPAPPKSAPSTSAPKSASSGTPGAASAPPGPPPAPKLTAPPPPPPSATVNAAQTEKADAGTRQATVQASLSGKPDQPEPVASASTEPAAAKATGLAAIAQVKQQQQEAIDPDEIATERRSARRRPAAPSRERIAANDDVPSIGGLIYALNQQPSRKPFGYAMGATTAWTVLTATYAWLAMMPQLPEGTGFAGLIAHPWFLTAAATWLGPIALFWFLAALAWRSEELHLRSTAMTEVAVRLAEPDRMAEQSVASLGQAVRRQVSFMNDAVSRALGRAGELEALVHREVSSLEQSYDDNERKIRGLISELSGERTALLQTGQRFQHTLQSLGQDVPALIERLNQQQLTLAKIIEGASENLTALESAIGSKTGKLEDTVGERTRQLHAVLEDYTANLNTTLGKQSDDMQGMLTNYTAALGIAFENRTDQMRGLLENQGSALNRQAKVMATQLEAHNRSVEEQTNKLAGELKQQQTNIEAVIGDRTETLQTVFEEYARAIDTTLAHRAQTLDTQLVERTKALDDAFSERLRLFDEAILRSTMAIDNAVGENARALTSAMESHAETIGEALSEESRKIDQRLMQGIQSVRNTSESISQQSLKAIEGLAGQADLLRNVSENLLGQINSVTTRFENQGQTILRSANALESANVKIDRALQKRNEEMNQTLERMSGKADELGRVVEGYSSSLEGSMTHAEQRARLLTEELSRGAEERSRATLEGIERLKHETSREADRALEQLRGEFSSVSREVHERLGALSAEFSQTTGEVRQQAARAAQQLEDEQLRLRHQLDMLPNATQETSAAMRKALQDQLRALDKLTELAARTTRHNDAAPPRAALPLPSQPAPAPGAPPSSNPITPPAASRSGNLSTLTSTLARELGARQARPERQAPGPADSSNDRWSLGDLLARASSADTPDRAHQPAPQEPATAPVETHEPAPQPRGGALDLAALAGALDAATAAVIWSRFRNGQRGFMVRSIYAPDARQQFDQVERRYAADQDFRANVDRFLGEFERGLHELDRKDPSRQASDAQIVTDTGRVYLVLAHAAKRLA